MTYRHAEDLVELAPAYDIVSTMPYIPRDTMALTMEGSKQFPDRTRLAKFVRQITGKSDKAAQELLDQVRQGVEAALREAADYGRRYPDANRFVARVSEVMNVGISRLTDGLAPTVPVEVEFGPAP